MYCSIYDLWVIQFYAKIWLSIQLYKVWAKERTMHTWAFSVLLKRSSFLRLLPFNIPDLTKPFAFAKTLVPLIQPSYSGTGWEEGLGELLYTGFIQCGLLLPFPLYTLIASWNQDLQHLDTSQSYEGLIFFLPFPVRFPFLLAQEVDQNWRVL